MYIIQHPEVKGDQNVGKFKDCFKVTAVDYNGGRETIQAPLGNSERPGRSPSYSEIKVTKLSCSASRALEDSCNFGKLAECKIYFLDSTNTEYLEITLTNAIFSNYQFRAHGGIPRESFDIAFSAIAKRHIPRDAKGLPGTPSSTTFNLTKMAR